MSYDPRLKLFFFEEETEPKHKRQLFPFQYKIVHINQKTKPEIVMIWTESKEDLLKLLYVWNRKDDEFFYTFYADLSNEGIKEL